ncbi:MAG: transcriptional repressor LexA [Clostridium sp.]|uniref:transcriptional repressor LexA n=1 Tax=Clostridium sp. DSM 8431 TaxID=1761781 RepID=UPI0008F2CB89|nr:transcriptional repressor LexA [Clostridium sp. DSM 8431]MCR4943534.1 transcriptional repressor LexA [Clostridium sp.]SFU35457.1 SOS regulatory protein LexA [Clostridium sp. DSM 8431]
MKLLKVQERFIKSKPNEYNIIKGRSNTGKSEAILHRILNMSNNFAYEEEDKILVVQKEKNSKDNLESRYKDVKNKHDFKYVSLLSSKNDPEFITLSKLISKYSNEEKVASLKEKKDIVLEVLNNNEFRFCKKLKSENLHLILSEIRFMKNNKVKSEEDYLNLLGTPMRLRRKSKARYDMYNFFKIYNEALLSKNLQDEEDKVLEALEEVLSLKTKGYVHIFIDNVESLSKIELDFLLSLYNKKTYGSVNMAVDIDKGENIYSALVKKGRVYAKKVFGDNKKIFNFKTDVAERNIKNILINNEEKILDKYEFLDLKHRREFDFTLEDNGHEVSFVGEEKDKYNKAELVEVPVFNNIAAGEPILINPTQESAFSLPKYWVKGGNNKFILKIKGDSMINANIDDGDLVVIEQNNSPVNGEIVAVNIDGSATLKRFKMEKEKVLLLPENEKYAPIEVTKEQEFFVLGKAIGVIKRK